MKGKLVAPTAPSNGGGGNQTDLLVCFPSRAHLALMPKAICSPSRPPDLTKRHHHHHRHRHPHPHPQPQPRQSTSPTAARRTAPASSRTRSSPLFKTKSRDDAPELDEPTSPKVTCAGQIKVRPTRPRSSNASSRPSTDNKNWISVMEEIERIHKDGKKKPGSTWWEAIGIKKDVLQIFSSFHGLRFNLGCFGSFPGSIECTSDEEEEDEGSVAREEEVGSSRDVFSKWFMLIEQDNDNNELDLKEELVQDDEQVYVEEKDDMQNSAVPPPNALLLMRCRSAPAKGLLNRAENLETEEDRTAARVLKEEEQEKEKEEKEKLVVMSYAPDFFKVSMDIAKETWVVGGELDLLARSRSWKR